MKKWIALLLVFAMMLPLCGCGKSKAVKNVEELIDAVGEVAPESEEAIAAAQQAYDALSQEEKAKVGNYAQLTAMHKQSAALCAKKIFENLRVAYGITEQYGMDVYEAWRMAVYQEDEVVESGSEALAGELSLSADEIRDGAVYTVMDSIDEEGWDGLSDEDKATYRSNVDVFFDILSFDLMSFCVAAVNGAYTVSGKVEQVQTALEEAKTGLKAMGEKYSDYENYGKLKDFYACTKGFFDYCQDPVGSFEQSTDTINNYRNEARGYISGLDYIFEE